MIVGANALRVLSQVTLLVLHCRQQHGIKARPIATVCVADPRYLALKQCVIVSAILFPRFHSGVAFC